MESPIDSNVNRVAVDAMIANPPTPINAKALGIKRPSDKRIAEGRSFRSRLDSTLPNLKKIAPAVAVTTELVK
jgi:hypothetical protein